MFQRPLSPLAGIAFLIFALGCGGPALPPIIGQDGQAQAKAAFVQILADLDSGDQEKVWTGLTVHSQFRLKESDKGAEKAKAVKMLRGIVGRKAQIKDIRGTRAGVEIEFEYATGKTRDLEMVNEEGAWKLNLFTS